MAFCKVSLSYNAIFGLRGYQAFIFKESESYHSPTLSLTAS